MNILVIAPHADDEVLGCGGTIAKYAAQGAKVTVCIITDGLPPVYDHSQAEEKGWSHNLYPEITKSHGILGVSDTVYFGCPAVMLETVPRYEMTGRLTRLVQQTKPDIVFIPHFGDIHKDHEIVAEASMVAVRPRGEHIVKTVYAYEVLSETEWSVPHAANAFIPNVYVDVSEFLDKKLAAMDCYKSQLSAIPATRSVSSTEALARLRGSTMGVMAAEAFMLVREYK